MRRLHTRHTASSRAHPRSRHYLYHTWRRGRRRQRGLRILQGEEVMAAYLDMAAAGGVIGDVCVEVAPNLGGGGWSGAGTERQQLQVCRCRCGCLFVSSDWEGTLLPGSSTSTSYRQQATGYKPDPGDASDWDSPWLTGGRGTKDKRRLERVTTRWLWAVGGSKLRTVFSDADD